MGKNCDFCHWDKIKNCNLFVSEYNSSMRNPHHSGFGVMFKSDPRLIFALPRQFVSQ